MNNKIMSLIELAMQFKNDKSAIVEFGSHINGVTIFVLDNGKTVYMKTCYLEQGDAEEKLDNMKAELEEMLKQNKVA